MPISRQIAVGSLLAAGATILLATSIAFAVNESPSPGVEPGGKPEATPTPVVDQPTAPAAPASAASPKAAATLKPAATAKPAATPKPAKVSDETEGPIETLTGTLGTRTDADGDLEYVLNGVELSVGPPWYWGTKNPLEPYVGKSVSVTGRMETDPPSTKANGKANNADGPEFEVYAVNGTTVRAEGKPPWAGGPKAVGERHPGYAGWSNGKADKADKAKASPNP
jgi:hypothetical protein